MDINARREMEQGVLEHLPIQRACDIPVFKSAIKKKTDSQLEDMYKRMLEKEANVNATSNQ